MVFLVHLPWDSKQLGLFCHRLEYPATSQLQSAPLIADIATTLSLDSPAQLIVAKFPAGICSPQALQKVLPAWRVRHLGIEVVHLRVANPPENQEDSDVIFYPGTADPSPFLALAWDMHFSRYHMDPEIGIERAVSLWRNSIADHCHGFAQETAVITHSGNPAGIATVHMDAKTVRLHIVGVLDWARGQGIGIRLLQSVIARHGRSHDILVEAHTENLAANALYNAVGCLPSAKYDVLHFWNTTR